MDRDEVIQWLVEGETSLKELREFTQVRLRNAKSNAVSFTFGGGCRAANVASQCEETLNTIERLLR